MFSYDGAGRIVKEQYDGQTEARYFYDRFPKGELPDLEEDSVNWHGYPSYAVLSHY